MIRAIRVPESFAVVYILREGAMVVLGIHVKEKLHWTAGSAGTVARPPALRMPSVRRRMQALAAPYERRAEGGALVF